MAAPAVNDDVPLLVRVLGGNPATGASILFCLTTADTRALRRLHAAVAGTVARVPWRDSATRVVDAVRWRAALPGAVGARLAEGVRFSDAVVAALAGVTHLDLRVCRNVTDKLLLLLPTSLRTLNARGCTNLTARARFAHLVALESLDCSDTNVVTRDLPLSLQVFVGNIPAGVSLPQLRVLRALPGELDAATLASLPAGLVELDVKHCMGLLSFADLHALQTLHATGSSLRDAALATLPPSLVFLDVRGCYELTSAAALPLLPALRLLDVSDTAVGDALVASLPAGLTELRMVRCRRLTARANFDHVPALQTLYSMDAALAPSAVATCRARGCAVPFAGVLRGHEHRVTALAVLADGQLASCDVWGEVRVWDAAAGRGATAVLLARNEACALATLLDGRGLAVGTSSCVEVWGVATGTPPVRAAALPIRSAVYALAVLADGRLAAGCLDGGVRFVDMDAGVEAAVLEGHTRQVAALAVLCNSVLASGSVDGTVRLWDVGKGACVAELRGGHTSGVRSLAVLADGRLASGTTSGVVALWDVGTSTCVGHVDTLAVLPDGRLVSGPSGRAILQVWDTRPVAAASSRPAGAVPMPLSVNVPSSAIGLQPLPDGRLACACASAVDVFLLEVPPPAAT